MRITLIRENGSPAGIGTQDRGGSILARPGSRSHRSPVLTLRSSAYRPVRGSVRPAAAPGALGQPTGRAGLSWPLSEAPSPGDGRTPGPGTGKLAGGPLRLCAGPCGPLAAGTAYWPGEQGQARRIALSAGPRYRGLYVRIRYPLTSGYAGH
jgi:hypothetical protein